MAKNKTYTVKGHRQIQREKEQVRSAVQSDCEDRIRTMKRRILDLFPGLKVDQVHAALSAGFDVTIDAKVSAKALMEILRS